MIKVNDIEIKPTVFSDNTSQVWKIDQEILDSKNIHIEFEFQHEGEIFQLMQLNSLLKYARIPHPITLHMPFLPYGRQDKEIGNENTFALTTFAKVINDMRFTKVTTMDAHSKIASELFDNFEDIKPLDNIAHAFEESGAEIVAYPDEGASLRYTQDDDAIIGHKVRNQSTGYIEQYDIEGNPRGKIVLIVDDICDGGMTFKLMAKELYDRGAKEVHLYVSHGIFSKGFRTLRASGIQKIFTKDGELEKLPDYGLELMGV